LFHKNKTEKQTSNSKLVYQICC